MSILWLSIVENSKTVTISLLGYPHTPHMGALSGRGLGGPSHMPQKIIGYVKSGNSKSEYFKIDLNFSFRVASDSIIEKPWSTLRGSEI